MNAIQKTGLAALAAVMVLTIGISPAFATTVHTVEEQATSGLTVYDSESSGIFDTDLAVKTNNPGDSIRVDWDSGSTPYDVNVKIYIDNSLVKNRDFNNSSGGHLTIYNSLSGGEDVKAIVTYS
ncbi:MAG: hypothetical protein ACR2LL_06790 [Nitrosopumilus sp.]|uniref:hypothetical protein n=1 Tax=Nitrosopumilus sp. TaxID=2024843 RepID=UPI00292EBACA|nr:hypothetical protein [Nitrosopumilus sp.]